MKEIISQRMKELGFTTKKLAETSEVSESTIKRILRGSEHDVRLQTLTLLAEALQIPVDVLTNQAVLHGAYKPAVAHLPEVTSERESATDEPFEPLDADYEKMDDPHDKTDREIDRTLEAWQAVVKAHENTIKNQRREKRILAIGIAVLVLFIMFLFAYDIFQPNAGWFKY